ncbi:MAG: hypothetical protein FD179_1234, partial [Erysipelotrichaceae bacterium]
MKYAQEIRKVIFQLKPQSIFVAEKLYREKLSILPEATFYKTLERMIHKNEISRIGKGVYSISEITKFGIIKSNPNEIINTFIGETQLKGLFIGYQLYNRLGLTTQISKRIEAYTTVIQSETKTIGSNKFYRIRIRLNPSVIKMIELMEVLEHYEKIEDLNIRRFTKYLEESSLSFNEKEFEIVLSNLKYKKRTIALLRSFLEYKGHKNTLGKYLSSLSNYHLPDVKEWY